MSLSGKLVVVAGGGAWGGALACHLAGKGESVAIWTRSPDLTLNRLSTSSMAETARQIEVTAEQKLVAEAATVVLAIPAQSLRGGLARIASSIRTDAVLVNTAKGIEEASSRLLDSVVGEVAPGRSQAILSGPSFAADVMAAGPVAVALAMRDREIVQRVVALFATPRFRVYATDDMLGVQLGGAYKNVIAIACGAAAGMELGDSACAALLARGFAELARLAEAMGARPSTLSGLSGLGDLTLTCTSNLSRNYRFGHGLGTGLSPEESALDAGLAEGICTAAAARNLFRRYGVEAPICEVVDLVSSGQLTAPEAVDRLLCRPPAEELQF